MKYRAVLVGVGDLERDKQIFAPEIERAREWAAATIAGIDVRKWPSAHVAIYQTKEELIDTVTFAENNRQATKPVGELTQ